MATLEPTGRFLVDFEKWVPMKQRKPPIGEMVEITDSDDHGWADFVFDMHLGDDGYFHHQDKQHKIAAHTITYWRPVTGLANVTERKLQENEGGDDHQIGYDHATQIKKVIYDN